MIGLYEVRGIPMFILDANLVGHEVNRIYGATFLEKQFIWAFPAFKPFIEDVLHDLRVVYPDTPLSENAKAHVNCVRASPPSSTLDAFNYVTQPFDHQRDALAFVLDNYRCGLFYDCGLGKTKILVDALRYLKQPALVIAPVIALRVWKQELDRHSAGELVHATLEGASRQKKIESIAKNKTADVFLVSYDSAARYYQQILDVFDYRIVIADESHYLRDIRSNRTKAALKLSDRAARRVLISGTPSLGDPRHLYGQLSFLGRYVPAKHYRAFDRYYLVRADRYGHNIVVGYKNLDLLNAQVQKVAIRKTAADCLTLPARTIMDVAFEPSTEQVSAYNKLVKRIAIDIGHGKISTAEEAIVAIQKMLQVLSGFIIETPPPDTCDHCRYLPECVEYKIKPYGKHCKMHPEPYPKETYRFKKNGKLDALKETLESLLADEANKVIVWGHFVEELAMVEGVLREMQVSYVRVDGSNSKHGPELAKKFNEEADPRVWLAQISTGVALTLTRAAYTVYYGVNYSLDAYLQSLDRNYRIGQTSPTFVYRLTAPKSVLEFVWAALSAKIDLARTLVTRIDCATCERSLICLGSGVDPFSSGCLYKSRAERTITRPVTL